MEVTSFVYLTTVEAPTPQISPTADGDNPVANLFNTIATASSTSTGSRTVCVLWAIKGLSSSTRYTKAGYVILQFLIHNFSWDGLRAPILLFIFCHSELWQGTAHSCTVGCPERAANIAVHMTRKIEVHGMSEVAPAMGLSIGMGSFMLLSAARHISVLQNRIINSLASIFLLSVTLSRQTLMLSIHQMSQILSLSLSARIQNPHSF